MSFDYDRKYASVVPKHLISVIFIIKAQLGVIIKHDKWHIRTVDNDVPKEVQSP